jgi:hypothetical protein
MFTVNSPLRRMNSRVPSSGSTSQKRSPTLGHPAGGDRLFGDHGQVGRQRRQSGEDQRLGLLVGLGHRRNGRPCRGR